MKTKVLVLGSTGMLGHQVVNYLKNFDSYEVIDISYRKKLRENTIILDVTDKKRLEKTIVEVQPDIVVNCIGILINGSSDVENAIYINAYLPHQLQRVANRIDAKLVHISTDCVFSGDKGNYTEADAKDGRDVYAKTKALGEIIDNKNVTLRTSIIGPELKQNGEGLFHWFMMQEGIVKGFTKAIWSGVTTIELVKIIKLVIDNNITGLYHVTNNNSINKYELLNLFKKYTNKTIEIIPIDGKNVNKSFVDTRKELNYTIPSYEEMVKEMIEFIKNNSNVYQQYLKYIHE